MFSLVFEVDTVKQKDLHSIPPEPKDRDTPTKEDFWVRRRIYYTGDMANRDGHGTVTNVHDDNKTVDIKLDDGRIFHRVYYLSFAGIGYRFEFADEKKQRREAHINEMKQRYANILGKK